jgi:hypothetical protein
MALGWSARHLGTEVARGVEENPHRGQCRLSERCNGTRASKSVRDQQRGPSNAVEVELTGARRGLSKAVSPGHRGTEHHLTPGSRSALLRNACHRSLGKVASVKGGGKPSAALSVGSRAFVNPKTLDAI